MPVHDVQMEQRRTSLYGLVNLLTKTGEIRRKDGRSQFDQTRASHKDNCGNSSIVSAPAPLNLDLIRLTRD